MLPDQSAPKSLPPTAQQMAWARQNAATIRLPDVIAPGLDVLLCGINPGIYSAATGFHFARPGNRFYPALFAAGITPRLLAPSEQHLLLGFGFGITNLVGRASATADEVAAEELIAGAVALQAKLDQYQPRIVAVLGIGAYRAAFRQPKAKLGPQTETLAGITVWVLPNPSGLNAHYTLAQIAAQFQLVKAAANLPSNRIQGETP